MNSNRPYLLRALYEWIVDNDMTPHLLVNAQGNGVQVPSEYVEGGRIVLNVSPGAVRDLLIGNEMISFGARFGGKPTELFFPPNAVIGIYARENGEGMLFPEDVAEDDGDEPDDTPRPPPGRPTLKVVK